MKNVFLRLIRLFTGLFLFSLGIVININANLGLSPWDVLNQGISKTMGITMGQANILIGLLIVITNALMKEKIGWGTIANMFVIGIFMDILMLNNIIPVSNSILSGFIMMCLGMFIIGIASYLYIGAGLGSGPRDGLMVILTKKTNKSVRFIRNSIEITALVIGYLLGGFVGIGTLFMSITVGYFVQLTFKIFNFDVNKVKHRYIDEDIIFLKKTLNYKST